MWTRRSSELAFLAIRREFSDQDKLFGAQNWPDGSGRPGDVRRADVLRQECDLALSSGHGTWRHIFLEEVFEAIAETDPNRLEFELTQALGVGTQWLEALMLRRMGLVPAPPSGHRDLVVVSSVQRALEVSSCG